MVVQNTACSKAVERQCMQTAVIRNNSEFFWWGIRWDGTEGNDEGSRTWEKILQRTSTGVLLIKDPGELTGGQGRFLQSKSLTHRSIRRGIP